MPKTLNISECKTGMRVKLQKPDPMYNIGVSNPAVGSSYECEGKIIKTADYLQVKWDNGASNSYKSGELIEVEEHFISIW